MANACEWDGACSDQLLSILECKLVSIVHVDDTRYLATDATAGKGTLS
jgi:hypothetical protein